jgi:hypothetical protein
MARVSCCWFCIQRPIGGGSGLDISCGIDGGISLRIPIVEPAERMGFGYNWALSESV